MNKERLKLYEALAKTRAYRERFGEWLVGDRAIYDGWIYVIRDQRLRTGLYLDVWCIDNPQSSDLLRADYLTWLPHVYDTEQPERSLLRMVRAFGGLYLVPKNNEWCCFGSNFDIYADAPDIALIKCILEQEAP